MAACHFGRVLGDRSQQSPWRLLAKEFTVLIRSAGHGETEDKPPYAVSAKSRDIDAVLDAAGVQCVYAPRDLVCSPCTRQAPLLGAKCKGSRSGAPRSSSNSSRPKVRSDYKAELETRLAQGRRGDMVELFFTDAWPAC